MANKHGKRRENRHHIVAQSRGGEDEGNVVQWDERFHTTWHYMFDTMTKEEVIEFMSIILQPGSRWTISAIRRLQRDIIARNEH